ncbi:flavin-containing monooxygenase [Venturia nashicola]|uniref:Flavin-containing monooxygenase n=1 Tax=Venturia nashicola TaxID=86259 RepID=A0A4Z1PEW1_9PEZI|nr:flavin-containing monooxygenase [Venturia nashicola]
MASLRRFSAQSVAIIGAGPSGLAAAKYFQAEKAFSKIVVFEQRGDVGGLWKYTPETGDGTFVVPQTNAHVGLESPIVQKSSSSQRRDSTTEATFISPIYERLETNIPKSLMGYGDTKFPDSIQLFPGHAEVQQYLEDCAKPVLDLIKFRTQVDSVKFLQATTSSDDSISEEWSVCSQNVTSGEEICEVYNAVVVASGHYSTPFVPEISGLQEWNQAFPGSISHSKHYRRPEAFIGKKVIVVGNSASGLDISSQISPFCKIVLLSQKSESYLAGGFASDSKIQSVSQISQFDSKIKTVHFCDGRIEEEVDSILFCTGYLYTLPFLRDLSPNPIGDGSHIEHAYRHLLYAPHPTLSFLALPQRVIPFPLSEAQSSVLARIYSGRLGVPSEAKMEAWETATIAEQGAGGDFHTLKFPKDANYINSMHDWAVEAKSRNGLENGGQGKLPHRWGPWEYWARENFPAIRKAFVAKGEDRRNVTTLEEIGFDFDESSAQSDCSKANQERLG